MKAAYDLVIHVPSLSGGGAERVAVDLAGYFAGQGKAVCLYVYHSGATYPLAAGVDLYVARTRAALRRVREFRQFLQRTQVGTVLSILRYANLVSLLAMERLRSRPRLVTSEHSTWGKCPSHRLAQRFQSRLLIPLYPRSDAIVAVSGGVAQELRARIRQRAWGKIVAIHNPCHFDLQRVVRDTNVAEPLILAAGRFGWQKAFDVLIDAFVLVKRVLPRSRLVILGDGPERPVLEARVASAGLRDSVSMPGFQSDIGAWYRKADLFVLSSRAESFGNVLVEALAYGLPIVSTDCEHGPREILEDGRFGRLVQVDDAAAMAEAIVATLRDGVDHADQLARAGQFALDVVGRRYASVLGLAE